MEITWHLKFVFYISLILIVIVFIPLIYFHFEYKKDQKIINGICDLAIVGEDFFSFRKSITTNPNFEKYHIFNPNKNKRKLDYPIRYVYFGKIPISSPRCEIWVNNSLLIEKTSRHNVK